MKFLMPILLLIVCFSQSKAFADDVFWVEMTPYFSYQDEFMKCGDKTGFLIPSMYLMAIVNEAKVVTHAEFRSSMMAFSHRKVAFTRDEAARIEVQQELLGDFWIKTLPLSARISAWLIASLDPFQHCRPPGNSLTLGPDPATLNFAIKEANVYYAPALSIDGNKVDGRPFSVKLGFWQNLMMNP